MLLDVMWVMYIDTHYVSTFGQALSWFVAPILSSLALPILWRGWSILATEMRRNSAESAEPLASPQA